ncbi:MAG: putative lipid II flippase FtsW [bacterium]|nr:putative lipid II flippase FtsW [bacterium]
MIVPKQQIRTDLNIFLLIVAILLLIGSVFIFSASSIYALEKFDSSSYFVKRQLVGIIIGLIALFVVSNIPLLYIKKYTPLFFFGSVALTALTLLSQVAHQVHGSSRWLTLFGFTFQPGELLKVTLFLYLAYFLEKKIYASSSLLHSGLPLLIILGLPSIILLKQPDFGFTVTLLVTAITLFFIARFQLRRLLVGIICMIPLCIGLIALYPYRVQRILTFLNPWKDPQGAGFQIIQSLIAIGSGGIWGIGIAHSKQKFFYLPMVHTDFIFSIIAEETGFLGTTFLLLLYILFLYFGLRIACNVKDTFTIFTILGFTILTSLQAIISIAVATGLAPTKGIGLPFVSYGNTSLVVNLIMVGIIINMVRSSTIE